MPGTFNYFSVIGDARHYRRVFDDRVVFASRLRYGSIDPVGGEADIPLLKRFFLGGSNEMRGWGVYELSPLSASGEPVGGKSMLTATAEVRVADLQAPSAALSSSKPAMCGRIPGRCVSAIFFTTPDLV